MKKNFLTLILSFSILNGCAAIWLGAGAGVGVVGYKYYEGELETRYYASYEKVYNACKLSLKNLNIIIEKQYKDPIEAHLEGIRPNGTKVKITIKNVGTYKLVKIRVGFLGDLEASKLIKTKIDSYVGQNGK